MHMYVQGIWSNWVKITVTQLTLSLDIGELKFKASLNCS